MVSQRLDKLLDQMEKYNSLQDKAKEITEKAEKEMKSQAMIAEKLGLKFKSANKYLDENNKLVDYMGREISRVGEVVTNFNKRTSVLTKTIESLNKKGKSFEIFSADSLKTYKRLGGNTFEYLAEAISGTREEITILGQEGAKVRKFAYGFLPSGTFRALNKVSSVLQAIGSATRRGTRNSQNYSKQINILKKDLKGLTEGSIEYTNVAETIRELEADMAPSGLGGSIMAGIGKIGKVIPTMDSISQVLSGSTIYSGVGRPRNTDYAGTPSFNRLGQGDIIRNRRQQFGAFFQKGGFKGMMGRSFEQGKEMRKAMKLALIGTLGKAQNVAKTFKMFAGVLGKALLRFAIMATIYITLFFVLVYAFRKPIMAGFELMRTALSKTLPFILEGISTVFDGISEIYQGFVDGDLFAVFSGVWEVAWGLLQISFGVLSSLLGALGGLIVGFAKQAFTQAKDYVFGIFARGKSIEARLKSIGVVLLAISLFFFTIPTLIGVVITAVVGGLLKKLDIFPFANGGVVGSGMQLVGERGPELVKLPQGSRVYSNRDSRKMGGGTVNNFNITVNAKDSSKAEMRRMADEIGRMINSKINRSTSSSTLR